MVLAVRVGGLLCEREGRLYIIITCIAWWGTNPMRLGWWGRGGLGGEGTDATTRLLMKEIGFCLSVCLSACLPA